jgi:ATP-dependent Lhr-like helicase
MAAHLQSDLSGNTARRWLTEGIGIALPAAEQIVEYLAAATAAFGCLPTQDTIVLERFFDEAGGMQLVIHAPFGSRINRAFGLALRKRFCRKFNFELQAAATEDNILLSLTAAHSFELADVARYLHSASVRSLLIQALLDAPMFTTRWRWVAGVALALPRFRGGKKVPPQFMRMQAEDLIAAVFPDQIACAENLVGEREVPDHPLTNQAISDCLNEAMDIEGLERLLARLEAGAIRVVACDLTQPSPLALEALSARPYAFLDDAPLEERRAQAVMARRWHDPQSASELGRLDPQAIEKVRSEAWPDPTNAEELHDALLWLGCLTDTEVAAVPVWNGWLVTLAQEKRATHVKTADAAFWVAAERLNQFNAVWPQARGEPDISPPADQPQAMWSREDALVEIVRGRLEGLGPTTQTGLAAPLGQSETLESALAALEVEGSVLRGRFIQGLNDDQWCDRRLLARIHHYTVQRLRSEIEPVAARDFLRFLFAWHQVTDETRLEGPDALPAALASLEGFEAPASAWETELLPARVAKYEPAWLDAQCLSGQRTWARLVPPRAANGRTHAGTPVRSTPIALLERRRVPLWMSLAGLPVGLQTSPQAEAVCDRLATHGALFFDELAEATRLLRSQVEDALAELVALGLVNSDSFGGLRALLVPSAQRKPFAGAKRRGRVFSFGMEGAGRWSLIRRESLPPPYPPPFPLPPPQAGEGRVGAEPAVTDAVEHVARTLLRRHGVVFWRLLTQEASWLPPWRDLVRVYRRLEARGEIRGGRFVAGFSGEQYALPDAVGLLRKIRRQQASDQWISVSGADPLNLVGILTPGPRLAALTGNRLVYRDGVPIAVLSGGKVQFLTDLDAAAQWEAQNRLLRSAAPALLADLA